MRNSKYSKQIGRALVLPVIVALTLQVSCSSSQVLATLGQVVDAAAVAAPIVTAYTGGNTHGVDPVKLVGYLQAAVTAASQAATEWRSPDSTQVKLAKIAELFSAVLAEQQQLGVIADPQAKAKVDQVTQAMLALVGQLQQGRAQAHAVHQNALRLNMMERSKLATIQSKADKTKAKLVAWKTEHVH